MTTSTEDTAVTAITDVTKPLELPTRSDCLVAIFDTRTLSPVHRRFDLTAQTTLLGRDPTAVDIVLDDKDISRKHARIERTPHGCVLIDEASRNGTLVNDQRILAPYVLRSGDHIRLCHTILKFLSGNDIEREYQELIVKLTDVDALTQLSTRRYFEGELAREINRVRRHGRPLSLVMIDIDHFKSVNDTHGHPAGDEALHQVGACICARLHDKLDVGARVGGEEMAVLMPETPLADAHHFAEELREAIASLTITCGHATFHVTVSIGCAEFSGDKNAEAFYARADAKLYRAKQSGRNLVCS